MQSQSVEQDTREHVSLNTRLGYKEMMARTLLSDVTIKCMIFKGLPTSSEDLSVFVLFFFSFLFFSTANLLQRFLHYF